MDETISDEWVNSTYSFNGKAHKWVLGDTTITWDGEVYHFLAVNPDETSLVVECFISADVIIKT